MGSSAVMVPTRKHLPTGRRTNKPLVEKKRRARINGCLGQLKSLLLGAMDTEGAQVSRLEKADILEMTVRYLRHAQAQHQQHAQAQVPVQTELPGVERSVPAVSTAKFSAGYTQCATEVIRYISRAGCVTPDVRTRLESHLFGRMRDSGSPSTSTKSSVEPEAAATRQKSKEPKQPRKSVKSPKDTRGVKSNVTKCHDNDDAARHYEAAVYLANMAAGFVPAPSAAPSAAPLAAPSAAPLAAPRIPNNCQQENETFSFCKSPNNVSDHANCDDNRSIAKDNENNLGDNHSQLADGWTGPDPRTSMKDKPLTAETTNCVTQGNLTSSPHRPLHIDIPSYTNPDSPTQGHSSNVAEQYVEPNDDVPTLVYAYNYNIPQNHSREDTATGRSNYSYTTYLPPQTEHITQDDMSHSTTSAQNPSPMLSSDQEHCPPTCTPPHVSNTPHERCPSPFIPPPMPSTPRETNMPCISRDSHVPNIQVEAHVPNVSHDNYRPSFMTTPEQSHPSFIPPPVPITCIPHTVPVPNVPHDQCPPPFTRPVNPVPVYPAQHVNHGHSAPGASRHINMDRDTSRTHLRDASLHHSTSILQANHLAASSYHTSNKPRDINNNIIPAQIIHVQQQKDNQTWQKPCTPLPTSCSGTFYSPTKLQRLHPSEVTPEHLQRHFMRPPARLFDFPVQNGCGHQMVLGRSWQRNCSSAFDKVWRPW